LNSQGDSFGDDRAASLPAGFKYLIGGAAFFIAGCSAFFSVRGLGLLFVGSSTAVMIMAASLEIGKLVAASFLYRYWQDISRPLRVYLTLAVLTLIGITSLGNYGFLARAYEDTYTRVSGFEEQVALLEKENADTQRQIVSARGQLNKATDTGRDSVISLQTRIAAANASLDQALARIQEKRNTAQARRDRDIQTLAQHLVGRTDPLTKALASEDALITGLNSQLAVLDRAVDAYTKQGGPGLFRVDSIKKGQELRDQQAKDRVHLTGQIADHRAKQEQLRAELAKNNEADDKDTGSVRQQFDTATIALDTEEKELRKAHADSIAQVEQQVAGVQSLGETASSSSSALIETFYQRIRSHNDEIRQLKEKIAATDIGSYRFVARAFSAPADDVVKWLALALVLVFDPLAVCLAVGFNVALLRDMQGRRSSIVTPPVGSGAPPAGKPANRPRWIGIGLSVFLLALGTGSIAFAAHWGVHSYRQRAQTGHTDFIPGNSFAVATIRPDQLKNTELVTGWFGVLPGKAFGAALEDLLSNGFDAQADVYAFAKFPDKKTENSDRPVMLAGLVARVTDAGAAEAALARLADQISASLRANTDAVPSPAKGRAMIRYGRGRYLDPEGGFFTFAIADRTAILLVELEGDAQASLVEKEMQTCLIPQDTDLGAATREPLPARALVRDGAAGVWLDAARFFNSLPKNSAAQTRYQQLQRFVNFDLVLKLRPSAGNQCSLSADYNYKADRFKDRQQPTALQVLAGLGAGDATSLAGQLLDRCADTLDYDSLIERLRTTMTGPQAVLVEKSFTTDREAQFSVTARNIQPSAVPVATR
jgi:hypothetical protein